MRWIFVNRSIFYWIYICIRSVHPWKQLSITTIRPYVCASRTSPIYIIIVSFFFIQKPT